MSPLNLGNDVVYKRGTQNTNHERSESTMEIVSINYHEESKCF